LESLFLLFGHCIQDHGYYFSFEVLGTLWSDLKCMMSILGRLWSDLKCIMEKMGVHGKGDCAY
jgi:hypothetical protein